MHRHGFGGARSEHRNCVGLEIELLAFVRGGVRSGCCRHEAVASVPSILAWLSDLGRTEGWDLSRVGDDAPRVEVPGRGVITLEPGGQIEYSGRNHDDVVEALDDVDALLALLETSAAAAGIDLRVMGFNSACDIAQINLQLRTPRYRAMDAHFAAIGPYGRQMMRATCALQINLDFGEGGVAAERWRLANMIAPSMNALFASSPHVHEGKRFRSYRGEIWRHVDPSRTGRLFDKPDLDPVADYLRFALDATVMMVRDEAGGCARPSAPMTFRTWLSGDARFGYPDLSDWELHLTTLFPDVRARGFMEMRSIDAQPRAGRRVAVGLVAALIYDDDLRRVALERLESRERVRIPGEHEHGGYWHGDLSTGRELLELALPSIDERLRNDARIYLGGLRA